MAIVGALQGVEMEIVAIGMPVIFIGMPGIFELLCVGIFLALIVSVVLLVLTLARSSREKETPTVVRWTCPHCNDSVVGAPGTTVPCPACGKDVRIGTG